MRNRTLMDIALRAAIAVLLAISGYIHAQLYVTGYRFLHVVGLLFLLQASASFALAVLLALGGPKLLRLAAAGTAAGALGVKDLPKPGDVRLGPGTVPAAVVRIPVKGSGDIAMLVGQRFADPGTPLSADAIRRMTGELAKEVHS